MVRQNDDDGRAKAERLLKRLEEKDSKMRKKWVDAAAKIARAWQKEGTLKPLYIVDALGNGREESWYAVGFTIMDMFCVEVVFSLNWPAPTCRWERT
jgi:hypothetical protein